MAQNPGKIAKPAQTDTLKDFWMPFWALAGGAAVQIGAAFYRTGSLAQTARDIAIPLCGATLFMLFGVLIAAKMRGIDLGSLGSAVLKLAAVAVIPGAVLVFIGPMLGLVPFVGGLLQFAVRFVLFFAMLGAMFDLDESDTWYCVCVIFAIWAVAYFLVSWS